MELNRKPTLREEQLLEHLIRKSLAPIPQNWKEGLLVRPMNDGGMGSLYLFPSGVIKEGRRFGKQVNEYQFTDLDGVAVIASLNVDTNNDLFELDIWKTDFEQLVSLPDL